MTSSFANLTDENFTEYAIKAYNKPSCLPSELEDDLLRAKYVKRLFRKYRTKGVLKERLVLNHLVILGNVFGPKVAARITFFKVSEEGSQLDWSLLKTFLLFLNMLPENLGQIRGVFINTNEIPTNLEVLEYLQKKI